MVVTLLVVSTTLAISGAGSADVGDGPFIVCRVYDLDGGEAIATRLICMAEQEEGRAEKRRFVSGLLFRAKVMLCGSRCTEWEIRFGLDGDKGVDWRVGLTLLVTLQVLILNFVFFNLSSDNHPHSRRCEKPSYNPVMVGSQKMRHNIRAVR